jgi:hypothetical protein
MLPSTKTYNSTEQSGYKCSIKYDPNFDKVTAVSYGRASYSGIQPHLHRGDHTTAIVTARDMVTNAVLNFSADNCRTNLLNLIKALKGFPGMQPPKAADLARKLFAIAETNLAVGNFDISFVPNIMDEIIAARNCIDLSDFQNKVSLGGDNESCAKDLEFNERQLSKSNNVSYVLANGDMYRCWRLLDLRQWPGSPSDRELAAIILQHLFSLRLSYPFSIGPKDYLKLLDYAVALYWDDSNFKDWKARNADILPIVRAAIQHKDTIEYIDSKPHPNYYNEFKFGKVEFY